MKSSFLFLCAVVSVKAFPATHETGSLRDAARQAIEADGEWMRPSAYDPDPTPITRALIEDGRRHLLLKRPIPIHVPVHILHGMADPDVPWTNALRLVKRLESKDVTLELVKHGDHRLSTPCDLVRLEEALERLYRQL